MRKFESVGDQFLAHIANQSNVDNHVAMIKHRRGGYVVAFKALGDELDRFKGNLIETLRSFAAEARIEYMTQYFKAGVYHYFVVKLVEGEA